MLAMGSLVVSHIENIDNDYTKTRPVWSIVVFNETIFENKINKPLSAENIVSEGRIVGINYCALLARWYSNGEGLHLPLV
jgi:hypothetical protein